jgi:hypothetical protein
MRISASGLAYACGTQDCKMPKGGPRHGAGTVSVLTETASLIRPRYLFVVSRQHQYLYELLVERFQDDKNVEVVLDRRAATRASPEDPTTERRRRPQNELGVRSHLIITRND